ncbi:hypothetical protein CWS02_01080 [Enterobacter sp. EA-1]|nr:hypothetical protein CWS02_01080 [Enterobacter sp. EA-1]
MRAAQPFAPWSFLSEAEMTRTACYFQLSHITHRQKMQIISPFKTSGENLILKGERRVAMLSPDELLVSLERPRKMNKHN